MSVSDVVKGVLPVNIRIGDKTVEAKAAREDKPTKQARPAKAP